MGTHFFWDPVEDNIQERDDTGVVTADYTTEPYLYGDLISQRRHGQSRFYCFDGQGSTRALTDAVGNVTDTYSYSAFGEQIEKSGSSSTDCNGSRHSYFQDEQAGTLLARARVLSVRRGRWQSYDLH
jgi:hypothetical protein